MKEYSDEEILVNLKAGQRFIFNFLEDRYLPMIRLMVLRMGGNSEDAKDIYQEGILTILRKLDENKFSLSCKFKTFLYCICKNKWKDTLIKHKAAVNYQLRKDEPDQDFDFTEVIDDDLKWRIFYDSFFKLDSVAQRILKLDWRDISLLRIAWKLGYTYGYVRKKKSESIKELKKRIYENREYIAFKREEVLLKSLIK
jgi:RNA polymerase sigma factor (sigma-70 family)